MLASLLGRRFWILAYLMLAAGLWLPGNYRSLSWAVPVALGGILFFSALKLRLADVGDEIVGTWAWLRLGGVVTVKMLVLPVVAWLAACVLAPTWAPGVLLVAAMPAGLSCIALTDLYRGRVGFALVVTLLCSVLAPVCVPFLVELGRPDALFDRVELLRRAVFITVILVVPFVLAQIVRRTAPLLVARHQQRWGALAILCSCVLVFVSVAANRHSWDTLPLPALIQPLIAACIAVLAAWLAGLLAARMLDQSRALAATMCWLYVNNGLALAFAGKFFPGEAAMLLPAALMQVPMVAFVALAGSRAVRAAGATDQERAVSEVAS